MAIKKMIAGALGASAAVVIAITALIQPWEGRIYRAEKDMGGVWSVCDGHTGPDIVVYKTYTDRECDALTLADAQKAEAAVDRLVKTRIGDYTKAALISFTYNVGIEAFARSTLLKKLNSGDIAGACEQLSRWRYVNGKAVKGLMNRRYLGDATRISERELCLRGIQ